MYLGKLLILDTDDIVRRYKLGELEINIAKSLGVSATAIRSRLLKAGIKIRTQKESCFLAHKVSVDTEILLQQYIVEEKSITSIAKQLGTSRGAITRRLIDLNVNIRDFRTAHTLVCHKTFEMTENIQEIIDGLLLSDAWIEYSTNGEGRLAIEQRFDRVSWLENIINDFRKVNVETSMAYREARDSVFDGKAINGSPSFLLRTMKYVNFTKERQRWYPNGKKIVPHDVKLSPLALAYWYWGDGGLTSNNSVMRFCTDGFSFEEVDELCSKLKNIYNWECKIHKHQGYPNLAVTKTAHCLELITLIRPYCPPCFEYKLLLRERKEKK